MVVMQGRVAALKISVVTPFALSALFALPTFAVAADLPAIKASQGNAVPACATPGRLQAFLKSRHDGFDKRFETIAVDYMKHGEALGLRWDYAFFHMIAETGALSFKNQIRSKAIAAEQNNFVGLGGAGSDPGERFADVSTGVRAHLQHLKLYTGDKVDNPIAERTRKVQQEGLLGNLEAGLKRPVTYHDFVTRWAPSLKQYPATLGQLAAAFYDDHCKKPDPRPELVALARGQAPQQTVASAEPKPAVAPPVADTAPAAPVDRISGADLARKALADAKADDNNTRSALGAGALAKAAPGSIRILNAPAFDEEPPKAEAKAAAVVPPVKPDTSKKQVAPATPPATRKAAPEKPVVQPVSAATTAAPMAEAAKAAVAGPCNVLTASYGGTRALLIKHAAVGGVTSYTVLDVNEGRETREADAYIAAYAKGGSVAGTFASQNDALDKAFELCPEG
jgi:hypothetical protein